jgi:hypothetical protein
MPVQLFSSPYVQTYKRTDRQRAGHSEIFFLFPYWGEAPAEMRPLTGPLSVSWIIDESL